MHEQEWKCRESDTKLVHGLMGRLAEDNLTLSQGQRLEPNISEAGL